MTPAFLRRSADASMTAACESLFPENDLGAPDWKTTRMVERLRAYLDELPKKQRRLLTALFFTVEWASALLYFRRFSKMSPSRRATTVRRWRRSRLLPLTLLGDALKATTTVIYMSHPKAMAHVGGFKTCGRPTDPLELPVRPSALGRTSIE